MTKRNLSIWRNESEPMRPHPQYPNLLLFDQLAAEEKVLHFSTTRAGGVSNGSFSSFNMGNFSDDDPLKIRENREILARMFYLTTDQFITPHQTHGTGLLTIDQSFLSLSKGEAMERLYGVDATLTREKGIFLCATTADCVPILLYDKQKEVIAAIHAGWRGTVGRIVEKTIREMAHLYGTSPGDLLAAIGPAISMEHYEVGAEVREQFSHNGFDLSDPSLSTTKGLSSRWHIDLKEINRQELLRLGVRVDHIEKSELCTYSREDLFFSARRQTEHSGRMLTGIMMVP